MVVDIHIVDMGVQTAASVNIYTPGCVSIDSRGVKYISIDNGCGIAEYGCGIAEYGCGIAEYVRGIAKYGSGSIDSWMLEYGPRMCQMY